MSLAIGLALFSVSLAGMEVFAYAMHRWVMHGPGWFLHASHHRPRSRGLELNDLYGAIFAIPSIALFWWGIGLGHGPGYAWVGGGIAAYGAVYFGFHDAIVHQRTPFRFSPKSRYLKRIVQAHRLHHAVESRTGAVSFGFIWAPRPERLKAELAARRQATLRAPGGTPWPPA